MNSPPNLPVGTKWPTRSFGFRVGAVPTIVVPWGFVFLVWVPRALLAPVVFAVGANFLRTKVCLTPVAGTMDSLPNLLSNQILSTSTAGKSKTCIALPPSYYRLDFPLITYLFLLFTLVLLHWEARALFASPVTTAQASLVGAVCSVTSVACTMYTHSDLLVDTLYWWLIGVGQR